MKIKNLRIGLENCECVDISGEHIGIFNVSKIKTAIRRCACNSINEFNTAKRFYVEINKNADVKYDVFGQTSKDTIFERLCRYDDIVDIEFTLVTEDANGAVIQEKHYQYYLDWCGNNDYLNRAQKTYISDNGHLYLVVSDKEEIKDIFDIDNINNKKYGWPWM